MAYDLMSNYPGGFANGVTVRGMPINQTHTGNVYWVDSVNGSDGNVGTFQKPFATLQKAIDMTTATNGDVINIKPGHTETISTGTALAFNKAGVAIIGYGLGTARPTFTLGTLTSTTIAVSAANVSIQNCIFKANFLSIVACFTVSAAEFTVERCYFVDNLSTLNFLTIITIGAGANTADGLTFNMNQVVNLGVTSNNTTINTGSTIDRFRAIGNYLKWAVQNDKPILIDVTTGILTNAFIARNYGYRPNTTTAGGSLIKCGGTTSTGIVAENFVQTLQTTTDLMFTTSIGLGAVGNSVSGAVGAQGFPIPALDS